MRILIFGAGVIGRIYAARLMTAGHEVSILSRGAATGDLRRDGIHLVREGVADIHQSPRIIESLPDAGHVNLALVAVRRDQLDAALAPLVAVKANAIASFINLPLGTDRLARTIGADRFVPAFPGVGGRLASQGRVHYVQIAQQATVLGPGPARGTVASALKSAGFPITTTEDMGGWLKTHAIFIAAFESALAAASGDAQALASDGAAVRELVLAVREGLTALHHRGVPITPSALRIIFQRMPIWFATRYWRHQLAGEVGTLTLAPHAMASQHSELPALQHDVRILLGGAATPRLERLFAASR